MPNFNFLKNGWKISISLFIIFITVLIIQSATLLLKHPPIWPDETFIADIANNWLSEKRLGTDLWQGTYRGLEQHIYVYPPIPFYLLAFWFKFFGFSILNQRLFSLAVSVGFYMVFFLFAKSFFKGKNSALFTIIILINLALDPLFSQATRFGRPEIIVVFFGTIALLTFQKSHFNKTSSKVGSLLIIGSGFFCSLAFLTHFVGGFFALLLLIWFFIEEGFGFLKTKRFYLFILSFLILPIIWGISILPNIDVFKDQLLLISRTISPIPAILIIFSRNIYYKIITAGYTIIYLTFTLHVLFTRKKMLILLFTFLSFVWLILYSNNGFWYLIYTIPVTYLAAVILIYELTKGNQKQTIKIPIRELGGAVLSILIVTNIVFNIHIISDNFGGNYKYKVLIENILSRIPDGKTVFLSSIPDPYYGFKINGRKNKIYESPIVNIKEEDFLRILNDSDYIVYSGIYSLIVYPTLPNYIKANTQHEFKIIEDNQYNTSIIQLKPLSRREILFTQAQ